jgi:hypothetical protein
MITKEAHASFRNLLHAVHPRPVTIGVLISLGLLETPLPHDSQAMARRAIDGMVLLVEEKIDSITHRRSRGSRGADDQSVGHTRSKRCYRFLVDAFRQNIPEAGVRFRSTSSRSSPLQT